jgi:hypothetical protein
MRTRGTSFDGSMKSFFGAIRRSNNLTVFILRIYTSLGLCAAQAGLD